MSRRIFMLVALSFIGLAAPSCDEWRSLRPTPSDKINVKIPIIASASLANGLSLFFLEDSYVPLIKIRVAFRAGRTSLPAEKAGNMMLLYEYLKDSSVDILEKFDALGSTPTFYVGVDESAIDITVGAADSARAFELLSELLRRPVFDAARFELHKRSLIARTIDEQQQPKDVANAVLLRSLYGEAHPLGVSLRDSLAAIRALTIEDLYHAYEEFIGPANVAVIMVGRIRPEAAMELGRKYFGDWRANAQSAAAPARSRERHRSAVWLVNRPGLQRTYLAFGGQGVAAGDEDEYALRIASQAISTKLHWALVEKGLSCDEGKVSSFRKTGYFSLLCDVKSEKAWEAVDEVMSTIFLTQMENFDGRNMPYLWSSQLSSILWPFQTMAGSVAKISDLYWKGLPDLYYVNSIKKITQTGGTQIEQAMHKYFPRDRIHIALVGDSTLASNLAPSKYGPVRQVEP